MMWASSGWLWDNPCTNALADICAFHYLWFLMFILKISKLTPTITFRCSYLWCQGKKKMQAWCPFNILPVSWLTYPCTSCLCQGPRGSCFVQKQNPNPPPLAGPFPALPLPVPSGPSSLWTQSCVPPTTVFTTHTCAFDTAPSSDTRL